MGVKLVKSKNRSIGAWAEGSSRTAELGMQWVA